MKIKTLLPIAISAMFLAGACSNDFDVTAEWKEIPVTYAVLDAKTDEQFIRVEKAFLDPEKSALVIAQIADSLYFPESAITVSVEKLNGSQVAKTYATTRVDGRLEGHPREGGIFANEPNWLYKFNTSGNDTLTPGERYRVVVKRNDGRPSVTGESTVPNNFRWTDQTAQDLNSSTGIPKINFDTGGVATLVWRSDASGVYFNITFEIRYREIDPNTGDLLKRDTLVWQMARNQKRNELGIGSPPTPYKTTFKTTSIYQFLTSKIAPTTDRVRYFSDCVLTLEGGGAEIEKLYETQSANNGVTGAEVVPLFTNMSEGYGIFTTKNSLTVSSVRIHSEAIQRIADHPVTRGLNFKL